jgi:hypothetical protein
MLLYAIHHLIGYSDMTMDQLQNFRQWGSKTAGHPEYGHALGVETTTGTAGAGDHDRCRHGARRGNDGGAVRQASWSTISPM